MRLSTLLAPTLRETPAEAEIPSHQLMLRAGLLRKTAAGIYTYLPLGVRVLQKVIEIVREEMNRAGGQELLLPVLQPAELWHETGRWDTYGEEMFKVKDRGGRQFCLGPTHEEIITALARTEVQSYRQLPLMLYQIANKYRDEIRPRFGLMRGREFIMKDLYSFDRDEEGLDESYRKMYKAYGRIYHRCGLDARPVEADAGAIGGDATHEFMVMGAGEARVVYCEACSYAANIEKAECKALSGEERPEPAPLEKVATPGVRTVEEVTGFLNVSQKRLLKTLIYLADGKPVACVVRGDHDVHEIKLGHVLDAENVELAGPQLIEELTGAPVGFAGPVGLEGLQVVVDLSAREVVNGVTGANDADAHYINVNYDRDYKADLVADIRTAREGDPCPSCSHPLKEDSGIEVGQIFKLGTKYSKVLGANYLDENGSEKPLVMGCYGIGVTRTMAAIIEANHDQDGIIWPMSVAPYHVCIVPVSSRDEEQVRVATKIYDELTARGVEAVLDDRAERPGVKFKDSDLIGFPIRVTVGARGLKEGVVEIKTRRDGEVVKVSPDEAADTVRQMVDEELAELSPPDEE